MNIEELKEAIKEVNEWEMKEDREIEVNPDIIILRNLAQSVVDASENLPKKKKHIFRSDKMSGIQWWCATFNDKDCDCEVKEYNQAIDDCTLAIAKREILYNELIMAVSRKFPNESRHETALRYIIEAENRASESGSDKEKRNEYKRKTERNTAEQVT